MWLHTMNRESTKIKVVYTLTKEYNNKERGPKEEDNKKLP